MRAVLRRLARPARRALHEAAARWPRLRRVITTGARELDRALREDWYDDAYFGARDAADAPAGYEKYDRAISNADVAAYVLWRFLPVQRALDVGCAYGFVVEALREVDVEATGVDVSQYAIEHSAPGARGHVQYGNLRYKLPFRAGAFELVTALETLEHLPPDRVPHALSELRRVTSKWVVATIPSFGSNEFGPGGWLNTKVRWELLDQYRALGDGYEGPVPYDDLLRDEHGHAVEGHLTIASFSWWTKRFAEAGLVRCGDVERRIHPQLARFGMTKYWNLYVLRRADAPEPPGHEIRTRDQLEELEQRWKLERWRAHHDDVERVREVCGDGGFEGIELHFAD